MQNMDSIFFISIFIIFMTSVNLKIGQSQSIFNVSEYGAKGDGLTDDSAAFMQAWEAFCGANEDNPTLLVPEEYTYLLPQQINFTGPCHSNKPRIDIQGVITLGPYYIEEGSEITCPKIWLSFNKVTSLTVGVTCGVGTIDGAGRPLWTNKTHSLGQVKDDCPETSTALVFDYCDGLTLKDTIHIHGPGTHIKVLHSREVVLKNLLINSNGKSGSGIDIENSTGVYIYDSSITTDHDCITIKGGSYFISINQVWCDFGGISVGDLGYNGQEDIVENIHVWDCQFKKDAMKIKTWPGGKGYARAISFHRITLDQSKDPIFIDQHYNGTTEQPQALKISDVTFNDIRGTSVDERAIILDCANIACENITLSQISITSIDPKKPASAICNHAHGTSSDTQPPTSSCLNH